MRENRGVHRLSRFPVSLLSESSYSVSRPKPARVSSWFDEWRKMNSSRYSVSMNGSLTRRNPTVSNRPQLVAQSTTVAPQPIMTAPKAANPVRRKVVRSKPVVAPPVEEEVYVIPEPMPIAPIKPVEALRPDTGYIMHGGRISNPYAAGLVKVPDGGYITSEEYVKTVDPRVNLDRLGYAKGTNTMLYGNLNATNWNQMNGHLSPTPRYIDDARRGMQELEDEIFAYGFNPFRIL